jgi:hypothetical protein
VFAGAGANDEQLHACIRPVFSGLREKCAMLRTGDLPGREGNFV